MKYLSRTFIACFIVLLLLLLGGCGQVITKPTATVVIPTATPTPTQERLTPTPIPTATPVAATPEPTSTPTPEPTPIIHTLQSGDTLIGLARKYGVTVQAIQEANGITDPRGLLVGQQIIIPTDPEARLGAGTPTPEPTPPPISISPLTFWEQADTLWVLGQASLKDGDPVEDVALQIDLLDAYGQIIASAQASIQAYMLGPGDVAGFAVRFSPQPGSFSSYYSQIISARPAHVPFYYREFDIQNLLVQETDDAIYTLSGEVVNSGADFARAIYLSVILYDVKDRVVGVRRVSTDPPDLPPGESVFFSASLIPVRFPVARYSILVEGQRDDPPHE